MLRFMGPQRVGHNRVTGDYEQLYGNTIDNREEMDRFLEKLNLPTLNQEEIEIMNNRVTSTELKL